jgi:hypothetical protein
LTDSRRLLSAAKKGFSQRVIALGFAKTSLDGVYVRRFTEYELMYLLCNPRKRSGSVVLEPLIALENLKLRGLIGEDHPQPVPRFAHLFLSYAINSGMTLWRFDDENGMNRALDAIDAALVQGGIPFAQRWTPLQAAVLLLRRGFAEDVPWGVITHPTSKTRAVVDQFDLEGGAIH